MATYFENINHDAIVQVIGRERDAMGKRIQQAIADGDAQLTHELTIEWCHIMTRYRIACSFRDSYANPL